MDPGETLHQGQRLPLFGGSVLLYSGLFYFQLI
jgi:hypothetical protein